MRCSSTSTLVGAFVGLTLIANTTACSFAFVETVPDHPEQLPYFDCTDTPGLPVADGVAALANAVSAGFTLSQSSAEFEDKNDGASRNLVAGISIGIAAIAAASGIYGLVTTHHCRTAKAALRARLMPPEQHEQHALPASGKSAPGAPEASSGAVPPAPTIVEIAPESAPATPAPAPHAP